MKERKEDKMMSLTSTDLKTWQVEYSATYWVEATSEDEAIDLAMEIHADLPDGSWDAFIEQQWGKR